MVILVALIIALLLGVVVCIHELGHFFAARAAGVLVEEFGFGMPPRILGIQKIGKKWLFFHGKKKPTDIQHTMYSLNALPIGGFVRLYGDGAGGEGGVIDPHLAHKALDRASVWWRFVVMVAGVMMNVALAVGIYYVLMVKNGFVSEQLPLIGNPSFAFGSVERSIGISSIVKNSPAEAAGLKSEDLVIAVMTNRNQGEWLPITHPEDLINIVKTNDGDAVDVKVKDYTSDVERVVRVVPVYNEKEKRAMIGAGLMDLVTLKYEKPLEKVFVGFVHSWNMASYNVQALGNIVSVAFEEKKPQIIGEAVSGPIGIGRVVDKILRGSAGLRIIENLLNLTAVISLSLAFINILPIPALDGGRILFLLPEMILGKKLHPKIEQYVNIAGFVALIALSIVITIKDIVRLW